MTSGTMWGAVLILGTRRAQLPPPARSFTGLAMGPEACFYTAKNISRFYFCVKDLKVIFHPYLLKFNSNQGKQLSWNSCTAVKAANCKERFTVSNVTTCRGLKPLNVSNKIYFIFYLKGLVGILGGISQISSQLLINVHVNVSVKDRR